jgi:hypothetical protein
MTNLWDMVMSGFPVGEMRMAQELACGDVFVYHDKEFLAISCITDQRHTFTMIVASDRRFEITTLKLFRTFHVKVDRHLPMTNHIVHQSKDEVSEYDQQVLQEIGLRQGVRINL